MACIRRRRGKWVAGAACTVVLLSVSLTGQAQAPNAQELDWSPPGLAAAGKAYVDWDLLPAGTDAHKRANYYFYFVMGVMHALFYEGKLCAPSGIQETQIAAMVAKYLNEHPERWQLPSARLVYEALEPTFPCKPLRK